MAEAFARIDQGVKRGKRIKPAKPSDLEREARQQARSNAGTFVAIHTPEQRKAVIADALGMLQQGLTTNDIGAKHGVTGQAVRIWLVAAQDEANDARTLFYSQQQVQYLDDIAAATDPLALGRARECFSGWHKLAQVRDPKSFGPKQEIQHTVAAPILSITVVSSQHAAPLLPVSSGLVIEHDKPTDVST